MLVTCQIQSWGLENMKMNELHVSVSGDWRSTACKGGT